MLLKRSFTPGKFLFIIFNTVITLFFQIEATPLPSIPGPSGTGIEGILGNANRTQSGRDERIDEPEDSSGTSRTDQRSSVRPRPPGNTEASTLTIPSPAASSEAIRSRTASISETSQRQQAMPGFPTSLTPTPVKEFRYEAPQVYRGIYLNNYTARNASRFKPLIAEAKINDLNTLVVDVQPEMPTEEFIKMATEAGFYLVSRVVVFESGLSSYPPSMDHINRILEICEESIHTGFMEVQLDYIRFADNLRIQVSRDERYRLIAGILKMSTDRLRPHGVRIGADTFGRISFNRHDMIGQQIELFAEHMDTLYPMLYPSHFYGDPARMENPYQTIYDGIVNTVDRSGATRTIAYIQGFRMNIGHSGMNYITYIREQIRGAEDAVDRGGAGYIVWNARNNYRPFFQALNEM